MPPSKFRPRKLDGKTKTYNVVFPVDVLDAVNRFSEDLKISPAEFVREAVAASLGVDRGPAPSPQTESQSGDYEKGVDDVCNILKKNVRLSIKLATGISMGEDIANRVKRDLL